MEQTMLPVQPSARSTYSDNDIAVPIPQSAMENPASLHLLLQQMTDSSREKQQLIMTLLRKSHMRDEAYKVALEEVTGLRDEHEKLRVCPN